MELGMRENKGEKKPGLLARALKWLFPPKAAVYAPEEPTSVPVGAEEQEEARAERGESARLEAQQKVNKAGPEELVLYYERLKVMAPKALQEESARLEVQQKANKVGTKQSDEIARKQDMVKKVLKIYEILNGDPVTVEGYRALSDFVSQDKKSFIDIYNNVPDPEAVLARLVRAEIHINAEQPLSASSPARIISDYELIRAQSNDKLLKVVPYPKSLMTAVKAVDPVSILEPVKIPPIIQKAFLVSDNALQDIGKSPEDIASIIASAFVQPVLDKQIGDRVQALNESEGFKAMATDVKSALETWKTPENMKEYGSSMYKALLELEPYYKGLKVMSPEELGQERLALETQQKAKAVNSQEFKDIKRKQDMLKIVLKDMKKLDSSAYEAAKMGPRTLKEESAQLAIEKETHIPGSEEYIKVGEQQRFIKRVLKLQKILDDSPSDDQSVIKKFADKGRQELKDVLRVHKILNTDPIATDDYKFLNTFASKNKEVLISIYNTLPSEIILERLVVAEIETRKGKFKDNWPLRDTSSAARIMMDYEIKNAQSANVEGEAIPPGLLDKLKEADPDFKLKPVIIPDIAQKAIKTARKKLKESVSDPQIVDNIVNFSFFMPILNAQIAQHIVTLSTAGEVEKADRVKRVLREYQKAQAERMKLEPVAQLSAWEQIKAEVAEKDEFEAFKLEVERAEARDKATSNMAKAEAASAELEARVVEAETRVVDTESRAEDRDKNEVRYDRKVLQEQWRAKGREINSERERLVLIQNKLYTGKETEQEVRDRIRELKQEQEVLKEKERPLAVIELEAQAKANAAKQAEAEVALKAKIDEKLKFLGAIPKTQQQQDELSYLSGQAAGLAESKDRSGSNNIDEYQRKVIAKKTALEADKKELTAAKEELKKQREKLIEQGIKSTEPIIKELKELEEQKQKLEPPSEDIKAIDEKIKYLNGLYQGFASPVIALDRQLRPFDDRIKFLEGEINDCDKELSVIKGLKADGIKDTSSIDVIHKSLRSEGVLRKYIGDLFYEPDIDVNIRFTNPKRVKLQKQLALLTKIKEQARELSGEEILDKLEQMEKKLQPRKKEEPTATEKETQSKNETKMLQDSYKEDYKEYLGHVKALEDKINEMEALLEQNYGKAFDKGDLKRVLELVEQIYPKGQINEEEAAKKKILIQSLTDKKTNPDVALINEKLKVFNKKMADNVQAKIDETKQLYEAREGIEDLLNLPLSDNKEENEIRNKKFTEFVERIYPKGKIDKAALIKKEDLLRVMGNRGILDKDHIMSALKDLSDDIENIIAAKEKERIPAEIRLLEERDEMGKLLLSPDNAGKPINVEKEEFDKFLKLYSEEDWLYLQESVAKPIDDQLQPFKEQIARAEARERKPKEQKLLLADVKKYIQGIHALVLASGEVLPPPPIEEALLRQAMAAVDETRPKETAAQAKEKVELKAFQAKIQGEDLGSVEAMQQPVAKLESANAVETVDIRGVGSVGEFKLETEAEHHQEYIAHMEIKNKKLNSIYPMLNPDLVGKRYNGKEKRELIESVKLIYPEYEITDEERVKKGVIIKQIQSMGIEPVKVENIENIKSLLRPLEEKINRALSTEPRTEEAEKLFQNEVKGYIAVRDAAYLGAKAVAKRGRGAAEAPPPPSEHEHAAAVSHHEHTQGKGRGHEHAAAIKAQAAKARDNPSGRP